MTNTLRTLLGLGALVAAGAIGATGASAQPAGGNNGQCTSPPGLNYMICNGQRVPKPGNRVVNPDGSWREEVRQGSCLVVKEKTASGEYKETRQCN
ncbi:hypothetical protein M8312_11480 [Sphingomonas sp. KRR8]|uniref:hypothetical protein n=1 Tax=Sphingomonas sp. KRR8 TaxID=2942996 RepID=UPI0020216A8D|nr:hypothetical protein [Sphingomonas sp. KRR8]URD60396.1 hypothetical protein M8312_11480 [Sphingomonas sp. KRR8]